jgi:hypothetical protein
MGEGEDVARAAPKGKGVIWGVIRDTKYNEPVIEAPVAVIGTDFKTLTDIDGRYRLELPPGSYSLRIFYELHKPTRRRATSTAPAATASLRARRSNYCSTGSSNISARAKRTGGDPNDNTWS